MIDKEIVDFTSKYFDKYYFTPQFTEKELISYVDPIITNILESLGLEKKSFENLLNEIKGKSSHITTSLKQQLTSIRKIKSFNKIFHRNVEKVRNDIYIPDIILISLVEVNRLELFDFIRKYQNDLSISYSDLENSSFIFLDYNHYELLKRKYDRLLSQIELNAYDYEILNDLFPHIKMTMEFKPDLRNDNMKVFCFALPYQTNVNTVKYQIFHLKQPGQY